MALWALWQPKNALPLTFIGCAMVAATLLDLLEEARFTARHGKTEILLSFDNVYLARHLGWVLEDADIAALPRARRFRSLFFFFLPLVKIDLMVPSGQAAEARARIAGEDLRVV
jgi:hypothetical protein